MNITGANTLLVTPFDSEGEVDLRSLERLTEYVIAEGVSGVMVLGSSGEFFTLNPAERRSVMRHVVEVVAGRVPVTLGVGSDSTAGAVEFAQYAEEVKADCLLVLPPLYFDQSPRAQILHFTRIARSTDVPVMLYDGAGGVAIPPGVIAEVNAAAPNVRYVKQATPEPDRTAAIIAATPHVAPLAGDDTLLLTSLRNGATGSSTAIGNLMPRCISQVHEAYRSGDIEKATALYTELMPVVLATSAPKVEFVARIKSLLAAKGIIDHPHVRPPLHMLDRAAEEELHRICRHLGVL
jgi:4-hydroxy-tetrahydrodipicolinate synthase